MFHVASVRTISDHVNLCHPQVSAIGAAGMGDLNPLSAQLSGSGPFTIFAPTNDGQTTLVIKSTAFR